MKFDWGRIWNEGAHSDRSFWKNSSTEGTFNET